MCAICRHDHSSRVPGTVVVYAAADLGDCIGYTSAAVIGECTFVSEDVCDEGFNLLLEVMLPKNSDYDQVEDLIDYCDAVLADEREQSIERWWDEVSGCDGVMTKVAEDLGFLRRDSPGSGAMAMEPGPELCPVKAG